MSFVQPDVTAESEGPDQQPAARLAAQNLRVGYGETPVIDGLDVAVHDRQITTVIGPNGCGKSTLLRSLARLLRPKAGAVLLDGHDIATLPTKKVAQTLGLLPQSPTAPAGLTVLELVSRGRHPHQSWYRQWSAADEQAVRRALELTDITDLIDRPVDALSGGQRQRVWIAMTLAQETDLLLLDEPTTFLDLAHAIDVLDLVEDLRTTHGKTVVMVLHDLNLAARYSDRLVVMRGGAVLAEGPPDEVITPEILDDAFGLRAHVLPDPTGNGAHGRPRPLIVPVTKK